jgi:hypothetical protein
MFRKELADVLNDGCFLAVVAVLPSPSSSSKGPGPISPFSSTSCSLNFFSGRFLARHFGRNTPAL